MFLLESRKPELFGLGSVSWQLFCTFTFKSERLPDRHRVTLFFSLVREMASNYGSHFSKVLWCVRLEAGELTGRLHLHALIAGLPTYTIKPRICRAVESIWTRLGGGFPVVRVYNPALAGADYILKGLEQIQGASLQGANMYEFRKFGGPGNVTLSESVIRVVIGRRGIAKTRQQPRGSNALGGSNPRTTQSGVNWSENACKSAVDCPVDTSVPGVASCHGIKAASGVLPKP